MSDDRNTYIRLRLTVVNCEVESLVTKRMAMIAENASCMASNRPMTYSFNDFMVLSQEFLSIRNESLNI